MVIRISDKTQNYSKVTKLLVKPKEIQKKEYADFKLTWSETKKFDKLYSSYIRELKYRVKAGE